MDGRERRRKVYRQHINAVEFFDEIDFVARYRLTKHVVQELSRRFEESPFLSTLGDGRGSVFSPVERVCVCLRYLATGANYRTISDFHGMSKATMARCIHEVLQFLCSLYYEYIHWPCSRAELERNAVRFYQKFGKPCTIGVIDGTQVAILRPSPAVEFSYLNRKVFHSMNVLVVSDADNNIIWVDERFPGSSHDSFVLLASAIEEFGNGGHMEGFWLLGDSAYTQKEWLMTPYRNPLGLGQRSYNTWHKSTRSVVERTFGLLKQRWRCLNTSAGYLVHSPWKSCDIIVACCVLHNIANMAGVPIRLDGDPDGIIPIGRRRYGDIIRAREALPDPQEFHGRREVNIPT